MERLASGVMEMVKGNEMVPSGLAVVAPCSGLAKSVEDETALIHASEMVRLGPGPVTPKLDGADGRRRGRAWHLSAGVPALPWWLAVVVAVTPADPVEAVPLHR